MVVVETRTRIWCVLLLACSTIYLIDNKRVEIRNLAIVVVVSVVVVVAY